MVKLKVDEGGGSELSTSAIELESSFIARMEVCARRVGSVSALAREAGISQGGIRRYFAQGEPSRPHLVAIARAARVSLEWLATGEGPIEPPGEEGGISSDLRAYAEREMGPDADEEDIRVFAQQVMTEVRNRRHKPSAHAVSEPPALPTPAPIETTQKALEVVEEAMGVVGYDPGSRAMTRLMGMLLDQDIKPEALPRILEILRDHESTRNGST